MRQKKKKKKQTNFNTRNRPFARAPSTQTNFPTLLGLISWHKHIQNKGKIKKSYYNKNAKLKLENKPRANKSIIGQPIAQHGLSCWAWPRPSWSVLPTKKNWKICRWVSKKSVEISRYCLQLITNVFQLRAVHNISLVIKTVK